MSTLSSSSWRTPLPRSSAVTRARTPPSCGTRTTSRSCPRREGSRGAGSTDRTRRWTPWLGTSRAASGAPGLRYACVGRSGRSRGHRASARDRRRPAGAGPVAPCDPGLASRGVRVAPPASPRRSARARDQRGTAGSARPWVARIPDAEAVEGAGSWSREQTLSYRTRRLRRAPRPGRPDRSRHRRR